MKRILMILGLAFAFSSGSFSQAVKEGTSIVDVTYGWPNLYTNIFKAAVDQANSIGLSATGFGPIGIKYEYMVAEKVGIGCIFNYANSTVKYQLNQTVNGTPTTYNYEFSAQRIRAMAKFSFHFGNSEKFDGYTTIALGYFSSPWKWESNDTSYVSSSVDISSLFPVAARVAVGGRYYFTDNIGALMEFGLGGGGLLEFGVTAKF
ncbi:MAG: hypothetical protein WC868_09635 [Bacteroidales bacterium]